MRCVTAQVDVSVGVDRFRATLADAEAWQTRARAVSTRLDERVAAYFEAVDAVKHAQEAVEVRPRRAL